MAPREPLPEDIEAERSLLSTICAPGAEQAALECSTTLRDEDFVHPGHRAVYRALGALLEAGNEVSTLTLKSALEAAKAINLVGGYTGLVDLLGAEEVGRPMVLAQILGAHRRRRELIRLGLWMAQQAQTGDQTPEAITQAAGGALGNIAMEREHGRIRHIADVSDDALASLQDEMDGQQGDGIWCKGWSRLNGMLGGFHPGQLIILAARPGIGKTALALNWVLGVTEYRRTAGIFSLEMPASRLWRRLASSHAGVDLRAMVANRDRGAFEQLGRAKVELDQRGIWIQDRSAITAREILGEVDALIARRPDLGLLVVDHLSLVSTPDSPKASRQTEATRIGDITRSLKILANDRRIPVLLLSQLNREVEHRQGGRPQLSDLRDSGCVEQDADVVMFIHRKPRAPGDSDPADDPGADLIVAKQREGPTGEIHLHWDGPLTRFSEAERTTTASWESPTEWV